MKNGRFLIIISILSLVIMAIGATFSYFRTMVTSGNNVTMQAATFGGGVEISGVYTGHSLIPLDDTDVATAYDDTNMCVDSHGFGACQMYAIEISNDGSTASYTGTINFTLTGITNLKYLVLDDEDNEYVPATLIETGTDQTLGATFSVPTGESKVFRLVIWLSNVEGNQDPIDAGGHFNASVTYVSTFGTRITGTFSGI